MIREAIEYIKELAEKASVPHREDIYGIPYLDRNMMEITPPHATALTFRHLTAFVEHVKAEGKRLAGKEGCVMAHVENCRRVRLVGALDPIHRTREVFGVAEYETPGFRFGEFLDPEVFNIGAQSFFDREHDFDRMLKLVGNAVSENVTTSADDGTTQTIAQRAGVTLVNKSDIKNPFTLAPHRTFGEIKQPKAPFILRAKGDGGMPKFALFEADNGKWQIEAAAAIGEWLRKALAGTDVPVLG